MSLVEQSGRPQGTRRPLFRMVAVGSAALFLLSTAYQASWGQGSGSDYDEGDDGLSGGETAAIVIGGLAGGYGLWLLAGADDDDDDEAATQATFVPGVSGSGKATAARMVAPSGVGAGERAVFDLQVQRGGKWQTVTNDSGSVIRVSGASVSRLDGAKNAFAVPMTAAASNAKVVGSYTQPDGTVLTAATTVRVGG